VDIAAWVRDVSFHAERGEQATSVQRLIAFHPPAGPEADGRIRVTAESQAALIADLDRHFAARRGFAVATINLDHLVKLQGDAAFRAAYLQQTHVTADGNPVVWLHRLAGRRVELVTGADLVVPLCRAAAARGVTVAFLGSETEVLDEAAAALEARIPGLRVVCRIAPPFGFEPDSAAADADLDRIAASGAGLCFLALGAPKQERLAARGQARLSGCGFVSVGAALDFLAGRQRRAPLWMRRIAMEWVWRILTNPRRLALRYARCAIALPGLGALALEERRGAPPSHQT